MFVPIEAISEFKLDSKSALYTVNHLPSSVFSFFLFLLSGSFLFCIIVFLSFLLLQPIIPVIKIIASFLFPLVSLFLASFA